MPAANVAIASASDANRPVGDEPPLTMEAFLLGVEKKGYRIALLAVAQHADALDILQDSMFKLVSNYAEKPPGQWKPLFYRILHNRITDWQRQQKLKSMFMFWRNDDDNSEDPVATLPDSDAHEPTQALGKSELQADVIQALQALPLKQQQCFLFRTWEGMSVKETAAAMECSEGSVKTHFFRAVQKLKLVLGESHGITI